MELSQNAEIVPMDMKMAIMNGIISDLSDTSLLPFLQKFNLTPAVWASKSSHLFAISKASSEIILAQQMIVNGDLSVAPGVSTLKAWLQTNLGVEWDEYIVPYDLISALCDGLIQIATNHPNDNTKGLYILLSTKNNEEGYSDPYSFTKFRQILLNLLAARLLPDGVTIADIEKRIFGKRIMKNQKEYGQHSKVVCVDRSLLFVGSDNIYPEYNEQHGVWIDSKPNIQAWHDNYFNGAWDRGVDVED